MKRTSLSCKIPDKLKKQISDSKLNEKCCINNQDCQGKIEWHHNLIFAGKRINEHWCILGVCEYHHKIESSIKELLNYHMLKRATDSELFPYCKAIDFIQEKIRLTNKYE